VDLRRGTVIVDGDAVLYPDTDVSLPLNNKYILERRLGGGGMAEVFVGRAIGAEGFSREVAIKRVLPGFSDNPQFADMLVSEARLTSALRHGNIVSVLDFDRDPDGRLFLVMELVEGTDLSGLTATGPLPFSVILYLAVEILRGLEHAHELSLPSVGVRGLVHRDISPHNVLVSWEGFVKISDFGIAKTRSATQATASIIIKGKPAYMSPEQARGQALDGRSDLFAVGVMLFEMVTLHSLFLGKTTEETFARLWEAPIPAPHDVRREVPRSLSRVIMGLLERDRDQRTSSAPAAIEALVACRDYPRDGRAALVSVLAERFVGRVPVRSYQIPRLPHTEPTILGPRAAGATPRASTRNNPSVLRFAARRRRRWPWAVVAGVVLVGVVTASVVGSRAETPPVEMPPSATSPSGPRLSPSQPASAPAAIPAAGPSGPELEHARIREAHFNDKDQSANAP
jgi:serine/threonine-protein kinase